MVACKGKNVAVPIYRDKPQPSGCVCGCRLCIIFVVAELALLKGSKMKRFLTALQFLTIIPVKIRDITEEDYAKSTVFFPVVGLFIGLLLALFNAVISGIMPQLPASVFILIFWVFITGALHLDGLADTFDGFYSGGDKEKILKVMEDTATGAKGAAVLVMTLLFKFVLISGLGGSARFGALVVAPVISRYCMVLAMAGTVPAREEGMGRLFIGNVKPAETIAASVTAVALVCLCSVLLGSGMLFIMALGISVMLALGFTRYCIFKIGGMTGDTLGALNEIVEVAVLVVMVSVSFMRGI